MEWKEAHWKQLLGSIARGMVVPVVGPDLLSVELADGRMLPFPMILAERLAKTLSSEERVRLPEQPTLHEVAVAPRWRGREAEFAADLEEVQDEALAEVLPRVLDAARPTPLRKLAEIIEFPLYLTTTPDALLERVLTAVRALTFDDVCTYYLRRERSSAGQKATRLDDPLDLPRGWEPPTIISARPPTLFYLFGRLDTDAHFDVTEERRLETLWRLQSEDYRPEQLMRELQHSHILLLGTRLPDWIGRYFIRLLHGQRLAEMGDSTEALADLLVVAPGPPAPLISFLDTFSQSTRLYRAGDPAHFVEQLHRRWLERREELTQKTPAPVAVPDIPPPPRDLVNDGCFISYRRADGDAAAALCEALRGARLPVWLDLAEIRGGDRFDDRIRRNVEGAAFFLPLLSANTCGQGGYFRKEWAWALARNINFTGMADRGYLRPIIVDATPQAALTDVPTEFTSVHIETFRRGMPTPEFLAQLLGAHQRWAAPALPHE
jgi:hypothetical protein